VSTPCLICGSFTASRLTTGSSPITAALCTVLPRIRCDYPRNGQGELVRGALTGEQLAAYRGLLGHYHVTTNKIDPGPAFDWERVIIEARSLMGSGGGARP